MIAKYGVSFWDDVNILTSTVVVVSCSCEYPKIHWPVHLAWIGKLYDVWTISK